MQEDRIGRQAVALDEPRAIVFGAQAVAVAIVGREVIIGAIS